MQIALLGPLEVHSPDRLIPLGGPRERAVLAVLALRAGTVVSGDALIDAVWGERAPTSAAKNVQTHVSQIRRRLRPADPVRSTGGGYLLTGVQLDVTRFDQLVDGARQAAALGDHGTAAAQLQEALGLWRGAPLADLRFSPVLAAEATRLEEERLSAKELQAATELALGRHAAVVPQLQRLLSENPLRERLWGLLMTALYRCGRQADALAAYRHARDVLVRELGIDPGPELQRIERQILAQDADLAAPPRQDAVAASAPTTLPPALEALAAYPLVGRDRELAELEQAWCAATAGTVGMVLLAGEPGIGKTRLAAALAERARTKGGLVLYGRCDPEALVPYQPLVEALSAYVASAPVGELRAHLHATDGHLRRVLPELTRRLPDVAERLPAPSDERLVLFDAVGSLLAGAARTQPVLLIADDVHWADAPTLLLLRHLLRFSHVRLLVVATYRDTDVRTDHALAENLALLRREPAVGRIALSGLSRSAVVALTERAALPGSPAALGARLHGDTRGNPLFVHEVLRHLAHEPVAASESVAAALPEGVREVIGHRLASLSEPAHHVLAVAALIGLHFDVGVVAGAADVDEDAVLEHLDEAVAAHLLVAVPARADRYAFPHALVRATLVEELSPGRRVRLHSRIAAVLERLEAAAPGTHVVQLAHHVGEAAQRDDVGRAVSYTRRAGDLAMQQLAYEDAERLYRRALEMLEMLDAPDPLQRCDLLLQLGGALSRLDHLRARAVLLEAADLARSSGAPGLLAKAAVAVSFAVAFERRDALEVQLLAEAEAALAADDPLLPDVLAARTLALALLESRDVLLPTSRRAMALAQATGNAATQARVIGAHLLLLSGPEDADERLALADDLLHRAEAARDLPLMGLAQRQLVHAHMERGSFVDLRAAVAEHRVLSRRTRHPIAVAVDGHYDAMLAMIEGRFDLAERLVGTMREKTPQIGGFAHTERGFLFVLRWLQGRVLELEPEARALAERLPELLPFRTELAVVAATAGRTDEAARLLDEVAPDGPSALPRNALWSAAVHHFALVVPLLGDAVRARALYEVLEPVADRNLSLGGRVFQGAVSLHLGRLAATAGRLEVAEEHLQDALRRHRAYGAPAWVTVTEEALLSLPSRVG